MIKLSINNKASIQLKIQPLLPNHLIDQHQQLKGILKALKVSSTYECPQSVKKSSKKAKIPGIDKSSRNCSQRNTSFLPVISIHRDRMNEQSVESLDIKQANFSVKTQRLNNQNSQLISTRIKDPQENNRLTELPNTFLRKLPEDQLITQIQRQVNLETKATTSRLDYHQANIQNTQNLFKQKIGRMYLVHNISDGECTDEAEVDEEVNQKLGQIHTMSISNSASLADLHKKSETVITPEIDIRQSQLIMYEEPLQKETFLKIQGYSSQIVTQKLIRSQQQPRTALSRNYQSQNQQNAEEQGTMYSTLMNFQGPRALQPSTIINQHRQRKFIGLSNAIEKSGIKDRGVLKGSFRNDQYKQILERRIVDSIQQSRSPFRSRKSAIEGPAALSSASVLKYAQAFKTERSKKQFKEKKQYFDGNRSKSIEKTIFMNLAELLQK